MWGTFINTFAIIFGGLLGSFLKAGISNRFCDIIMQGLGLTVCLIGLKGALMTSDILIVIISVVIGAVIGECMQIEQKLEQLGDFIQKKVGDKNDNTFSEGFVTASLVYCVGAMAIVGSLESGLKGVHTTLYAKSILDGISAIIFASTLGIGVVFSAVSVLLYQGFITITAHFMEPFLTNIVRDEMSAVGGLLIFAIGLTMMGIKKIKVGNLLPAIFIPIFYFPIIQVIRNIIN